MRHSQRDERIRLFTRGNTSCPICLSPFTRQDVLDGDRVNLEHVPFQGLQKKFPAVDSLRMCITCTQCNQGAGRGMEQALLLAMSEPTAHVKIRGVSHTARLSKGSDDIYTLELSELRVPRIDSFRLTATDIEMTMKIPNEHFVSVTLLKSAYLSVFSLLGQQGYRYAATEAISQVRRQIMHPDTEIIGQFALSDPSGDGSGWIAWHRDDRPCWAVKMGDCIVLLPAGGDARFYRDTEIFVRIMAGNQVQFRMDYSWHPVKFGKNRVVHFTFQGGYSPEAQLGSNPFKSKLSLTEHGNTDFLAIVDYSERDVVALPVQGWVPDS